jgi:hypothetical protein
MIMHQLLNRIFGLAEEINGGHRCPTYMYRWTIAATRWGKLYVHKFVGDDWSFDLHDHPKRFVSIGVCGRYWEATEKDGIRKVQMFVAPWWRSFPAEHRHRIFLSPGYPNEPPPKPCWTLVWVGLTEREWGFWHEGSWMPWRDYVNGKDGVADKMKACD